MIVVSLANMSLLFVVKQKTAYERRISDWSSDVCSSDLLAIVLGADLPRVVAFDVAARLDPGAAQRGETGHDVDARGRIGIGAGGVVDAQRRLAAAGFENDLAPRDADAAAGELGAMDLAAAAERAGGDACFGLCGEIGPAGSSGGSAAGRER